jgi:capsular exopolysaccharide synthesis family protein
MRDGKQAESEINIRELLQILVKHKFFIAAVTLGVVVIVMLYHFSVQPVYRATAVVMTKDEKEQDWMNQITKQTAAQEAKPMDNEIELLKSYPMAEATVRSLYNSSYRDSLELFGKRLYEPPAAKLFGGLVPYFKSLFFPQEKELQVEEKIKRYSLAFQKRVNVENARESNLLNISVSSPFAKESALLTNALCKTYQRKDIEWNVEQAANVNKFVAEQLEKQKQKVADVENAMSGYMKQEDIYETTGNADQLLKKVTEVDSKYNDIQAEYNILKKRLDFIKQKLSDEEKAFGARIAQNVNTQLQAVKERIKAEESLYMQLASQKGSDNPEVVAKRQQIDMMKAQLEQITRNKIAGELAYAGRAQKYQFDLISEQHQTDVKLAELDYSAQEFQRLKQYYEGQLSSLPQKQLNYARLQRDRDVVSNTYTFLKQKLDESRIKVASEAGKVIIVGPAFPPIRPVSPNLGMDLLISTIFGLGFGVVLVLLFEFADPAVKDEQFFEDHGFVTLGMIPVTGEAEKKTDVSSDVKYSFSRLAKGIRALVSKNWEQPGDPDYDESQGGSLLITDNLASAFSESFRDLRTNITFSKVEDELKSLLVTGTGVSEGKSTVCSNLALAFALTGKQVLVVDCDLRRPSQYRNLSVEREPGLSDYLAGEDKSIDALVRQTNQPNLYVLPSGRMAPNPNELLGSVKMADLVRDLESKWDLVLIDSTPLLLLSDAALLSQSVDGILLVARVGKTSRKLMIEVNKIAYLKPALLGVAVIGTSVHSKYGYDKSSYSKYGVKA